MNMNEQATRLTARVAPFRDAILAARKAGWTWADVARALGLNVSPDRIRAATKFSTRYEVEQIPLPLPEPAPAPVTKAAASRPGQSTKDFLASLKQIGGEK